jgi:hypothetical protein
LQHDIISLRGKVWDGPYNLFNTGGVPVEEIPNILSKEIKLYISSAGTGNKKRNEKCHTVGTFPKFKRKIIEIGKIGIPKIPIHDRSFP